MIADFIRYVDTLVQFYRVVQKVDAAGDTLHRIFHLQHEKGSSFLECAVR